MNVFKYLCEDCVRYGGAEFAQCKPGPDCDMGNNDDQAKPSGWVENTKI